MAKTLKHDQMHREANLRAAQIIMRRAGEYGSGSLMVEWASKILQKEGVSVDAGRIAESGSANESVPAVSRDGR